MTRDRGSYDLFGAPEREFPREDVRGTKTDLVNVTLILREDRPLSLMVHRPEQLRDDPWISIPKSQIEYDIVQPGCVVVSLPQWLATDKGLV